MKVIEGVIKTLEEDIIARISNQTILTDQDLRTKVSEAIAKINYIALDKKDVSTGIKIDSYFTDSYNEVSARFKELDEQYRYLLQYQTVPVMDQVIYVAYNLRESLKAFNEVIDLVSEPSNQDQSEVKA